MASRKPKVGSVELQGSLRYAEGPIDDSSPSSAASLVVFFTVLKNNTLFCFASSKDVKEVTEPKVTVHCQGSTVTPLTRLDGMFGIQIEEPSTTHRFYMEAAEDQQTWLASLLRTAVATPWPSGKPFSGTADERAYVQQLPKLLGVAPFRRKELVLKKLQLCAVIYNFNEATFQEEKQIKRQTLLELVDLSDGGAGNQCIYNDYRTYVDTMKMIDANLYRALPNEKDTKEGDDGEEPFMEPAWPHLSLVYELLLRMVQQTRVDLAIKKKATTVKFLKKLLEMFNTADVRERDFLKTSTHRIYGKLTNRRASIRRGINNIFFGVLYETRQHAGISELLEILASIINGFAVPIKDEHKQMLERALIPLHKMPAVNEFHHPLSYCMVLFCGKDITLTKQIMCGLLRFWPCGNHQKELLFLQEMDELFEFVTTAEFNHFRRQFALRLHTCISCPHFQVAERALWFWNNEFFVQLAVRDKSHRPEMMEILFDELYRNSVEHWHDSVKSLSEHVIALYQNEDKELYDMMLKSYQEKASATAADPQAAQAARWKALEATIGK